MNAEKNGHSWYTSEFRLSVENTPTNHRNMLSVKTLEHYDNVSLREFFVRIKVSLFFVFRKKKICPFLKQYTLAIILDEIKRKKG